MTRTWWALAVAVTAAGTAAAEPAEPTATSTPTEAAEPAEPAAPQTPAEPAQAERPSAPSAVIPPAEPAPIGLLPQAVLGVDPSTLDLLRPLPPAPPWGLPPLLGGTGAGCLDHAPGLALDPWCRVAVESAWGPATAGPAGE